MPNAASALAAKDIRAICQISDNMSSSAFPTVASAARKAGLPLFCYQTPQAQAGAVIAVARDFLDAGKAAGKLAARIMRGENPANLPFEMVANSQLVINLEAAQAIGFSAPPELMKKADGFIDAKGYRAARP